MSLRQPDREPVMLAWININKKMYGNRGWMLRLIGFFIWPFDDIHRNLQTYQFLLRFWSFDNALFVELVLPFKGQDQNLG